MSQATDYLEESVLNAIASLGAVDLADGTVTAGTGGFIGLFTAAPNDTGGGTECAGGSYARFPVTAAGFGAAAGGAITNAAEFKWADATADWGTVTHIGLFDAVTTGNLIVYGSLTSSVAINNGDIFKIPASGFTIQMN